MQEIAKQLKKEMISKLERILLKLLMEKSPISEKK